MKLINKIKHSTPKTLWPLLEKAAVIYKKIKYRIVNRHHQPRETTKARPRRINEGFFEKFCHGKGLDIGYGGDLLCENCRGWDIEDGDAQFLNGLANSSFDFVYSSHTLEHIADSKLALSNWWRVLKPNGYLILYLPERDLYEKKKTLPSRWSASHKHFFLLDKDQLPDTLGIVPIVNSSCRNSRIIYARICDHGHTITDPYLQSDGEYSVELVAQKLPEQK